MRKVIVARGLGEEEILAKDRHHTSLKDLKYVLVLESQDRGLASTAWGLMVDARKRVRTRACLDECIQRTDL